MKKLASKWKPRRGLSLPNKYWSLFLVTALLSTQLFGQYPPLQRNNSTGFIWKRGVFDSLLKAPFDTLVKPRIADSGSVAIKGLYMYVWNGYKWNVMAGGGSGEGGGPETDPTVPMAAKTLTDEDKSIWYNKQDALVFPSYNFQQSADTLLTRTPVFTTAALLRSSVTAPSTASVYKLFVNGVTRDYLYNPSNTTSVDDSVMYIRKAGGGTYEMVYDYVDPWWFGFIPGTGTDMTSKLQKAVNFAINSTKSHKIIITHNGTYIVNDLIIAKYNGSNQSQQVTLSMEALAPADDDGVKFYTNNGNSATIHIQTAKGVYIKGIVFKGPRPDLVQNFVTGDWTNSGAIRSNAYSPNCPISIDNLFTGANTVLTSSSQYYPNVPASYYLNTTYQGSSNIILEDNVYELFYAGIAQGLSNCPQGENIKVKHGYGYDIKHFWISGQLQSRENTIEDFFFFNGDAFLTNVGYGSGLGDLPAVIGGNINNCKYLFQAQSDFTHVRFSGGYSEAIWSLGKSTSNNPVNFDNWSYTSLDNDLISGGITASSPVWVEAKSLSWKGGYIRGSNYNTGFPMSVYQAEFTGGVVIGGNLPFNTNPEFFDRILFRNAQFTAGHGNTSPFIMSEGENNLAAVADEATYYNRFLLPGSKFKSRTNRIYTNVGNKIDRISVGDNTITLNTSTRVATFTPATTGKFQVGDMIVVSQTIDYGSDVYTGVPTMLGYISGISGGTVTVSYVPAGFVSGTYSMYIARVPTFQPHILGTVTSGNDTIKSIISEDGSTFTAGASIKGFGIPAGAYVAATGSTWIKMSVAATSSATATELYDARIQISTTNEPFDYFGSPTSIFTLGAVWFKGDEIKNVTGGEPRSWQVTTAGKQGSGNAPVFSSDGVGTENQIRKWVNGVPVWTDLYNGVKLTGTPFGSTPLNFEPAFGADQAFDDSLQVISAWVSAANPAYVGLSTASTYVITKIRYYPVAGAQSALTLQGSNTSNSSGFEDIYTLPSAPIADVWNSYSITSTKGYKYFRLYQANPSNVYVEAIEIEFYGYEINGIQVTTTGTSGAATFINGVLNIPQYGSGGGASDSAYVRMYGLSDSTGVVFVRQNGGRDTVLINASAVGGGGGGSATWGAILGTITDQVDLQDALALKQATLVSGTNIKTVNGNSLLGPGNVVISGLPSETGNSGKFLTTNGSTASWKQIDTADIANFGIRIKALLDANGVKIKNDNTAGRDTLTSLNTTQDTLFVKSLGLQGGTGITVSKTGDSKTLGYQIDLTGTSASGKDINEITSSYTITNALGMEQRLVYFGGSGQTITFPTGSEYNGMEIIFNNSSGNTLALGGISSLRQNSSTTVTQIDANGRYIFIKKISTGVWWFIKLN